MHYYTAALNRKYIPSRKSNHSPLKNRHIEFLKISFINNSNTLISMTIFLLIRYEVRDFPSKIEEKQFVAAINLMRRHLNDFQKAEMGMILLEVTKKIAEAHTKAGTSVPNGAQVGRSTEYVAKQIGLSKNTFERAKKVIEQKDEELSELLRRKDGKSINYGYEEICIVNELPTGNGAIKDRSSA